MTSPRDDGLEPEPDTTGADPQGTNPAAPPPAGAAETSAHDDPTVEPLVDPTGASIGDQSLADELAVTQMALAERTSDLQRIQAEFINYKRRVERDRELVRENARFAVLSPIIDVLDTIDRAREHGELDGGFKAVAEQLERVVAAAGLTRYGAAGDPFDPTLHEALSHVGTSPDVDTVTCQHIVKAGYRIGDRVVRVAQVLVVDPAEPVDSVDPGRSGSDAPAAGPAQDES